MAGKIKVPDDCSYRTYSVCESAADSSNRVEEDGEIDGPAVFMCGKCKLPIGDSLSWAGSDDEQNQIMLKRITDNIVIGKEPFVSGTQKELGCLVVNLTCHGCGAELGIMYISTPKKLDFKRSLFCFNVENIESYVVGSPGQQMPELDRQDRPVTLEYQNTVEQQMTEADKGGEGESGLGMLTTDMGEACAIAHQP
ncbi:protein Mis18-alpha isoform X1 [Rhinichthys klamathensis goyatoka]|uniref:protein Mis18-alpha isoform X1 n=1 Tax=Rhinichthys klamathensis goyatoka TaxID=3034132 RepID=UPI0024B5FC94|nr:protein Mis18-alpha isoform X1 [Rhinichthys klamathensis goyatoka]